MATCGGISSADAAVLTSTDGLTWTAVPDVSALHGEPMLDVAVRDGDFVAVGGANLANRSATWTSHDGRHWTRSPSSSALRSGWMSGVAALGTQALAVGANVEITGCSSAPVIWRSADGRDWSLVSRVARTGTAFGAGSRIAATPSVAVAYAEYTSQAPTWTSSDGAHWASHAQAQDLELGPIVALPDGFVAASALGLLTSVDGVAWAPQSGPTGAVNILAVGPSGVLAIGDEIWLGPATIR